MCPSLMRITTSQAEPKTARFKSRDFWSLIKRSAALMLFRAGESHDSICDLVGCTKAQLISQFPRPPSPADRDHYEILDIVHLFKGEYVVTDIELIKDTQHSDESFRLMTVNYNRGVRLVERTELIAYLRRKALRSLGYDDRGYK